MFAHQQLEHLILDKVDTDKADATIIALNDFRTEPGCIPHSLSPRQAATSRAQEIVFSAVFDGHGQGEHSAEFAAAEVLERVTANPDLQMALGKLHTSLNTPISWPAPLTNCCLHVRALACTLLP